MSNTDRRDTQEWDEALQSAGQPSKDVAGEAWEGYTGTEGSGKKIVDVDNLPGGWTKTTNNGFTHVKDANGNIRVRIDPPDAKTPYPHKHLYDEAGNSLDINGNIVSPKSPDAHIPLK